MGLANVPLTGLISRGFRVPTPAAARSRATPRTPRQSPRLGVTPISITGSLSPRASGAGVPITASSGKSTMPSWSSERPISRSLNNMPLEVTPRIFDFLSVTSIPGIYIPSLAKIPFMPARALGAPQTTSNVPVPLFTAHTFRRSASGCFSAFSTWATTKSLKPSEGSSRLSSSRPAMVRASVISVAVASVSSSSLSQLRVNFMTHLPGSTGPPWTAHPEIETRSGATSGDQSRRKSVDLEFRILT